MAAAEGEEGGRGRRGRRAKGDLQGGLRCCNTMVGLQYRAPACPLASGAGLLAPDLWGSGRNWWPPGGTLLCCVRCYRVCRGGVS